MTEIFSVIYHMVVEGIVFLIESIIAVAYITKERNGLSGAKFETIISDKPKKSNHFSCWPQKCYLKQWREVFENREHCIKMKNYAIAITSESKKCFPTRDHLSTWCYLTVYWRRNTILSFSSLLICPKRVQLAAYIEPDRILLSFSILTLTFPVRSQIYCINYKTTQKKARHIHNSHMFLHIFLCSPWTWFIEITRRARPKKNFSVELIFLLD